MCRHIITHNILFDVPPLANYVNYIKEETLVSLCGTTLNLVRSLASGEEHTCHSGLPATPTFAFLLYTPPTYHLNCLLVKFEPKTLKQTNKQKQCRPRGRLAAQKTRERPPGLEAWSGFAHPHLP